MKTHSFFDRPRHRVRTSLGEVELPIQYRDLSAVFAFFSISPARAEALLQHTPLVPVRFLSGTAIAAVSFFDYRDTSIGPYRECGVSLAVVPRGQRQPRLPFLHVFRAARHGDVGSHILDLPVTSEVADVGGRELWGYPKFQTKIEFRLEGQQFRGAVLAPDDGRPILTLEGRLGHGAPLPMTDLLLYSQHNDVLLRTRVSARGAVHSSLGRGLLLRVGDGAHVMVDRLHALGLDGAHPRVVQAGTKLQTLLPAGEPVALSRAA